MKPSHDLIIFKQLFERHPRVEIPMIQRDYAQGRPTQNEVRERFLNALHGALVLPANDPSLPLNLDFIYGSVEEIENQTRFLPLDGQQRLTTLFLLHWYVAWQDDRLNDFRDLFGDKNKSRFSYSVRPSSQEFFDELVNFAPAESPATVASLSDLICDQPWYFRSWRLDPSIQSSLAMLDAIHQRFNPSQGLFARLCDASHPAITFQWLDLEHFGLSDDLYIKMNARGKPLTAFETFKARYEQELATHFGAETRLIDGQDFPLADFVALRMDTAWSDLFWAHRDPATNSYDSAVMNLFRAVALVTRNPEDVLYTDKNPYVDDVTRLRDSKLAASYSEFEAHNWLNPAFTRTLIALLEAWSSHGGNLTTLLPDARYFDERAMFKKLAGEPTSLTFAEITQFAAYASFVRKHEGEIDPQAFQEWMRIIFNLSTNTGYNSPIDLQRSVSGLRALLPQSEEVLEHFALVSVPITGFYRDPISEEKLKAELILNHDGWRPWLDRAEGHGYFRGQIGFLLDFSGVLTRSQADPVSGWDDARHASLQEQFEQYLRKAEAMFAAQGLNDLGDYRWQRALLSLGDYWLTSGQNRSFLVNSSTDPLSWKQLLKDKGEHRDFLKQLWDLLGDAKPLKDQLDGIIADASELEPWREALVRTPVAMSYCDKQLIRWESPEKIYLLRTTRMSGAHAELFTYCLHQNVLALLFQDGELEPLWMGEYYSAIGLDENDLPRVMMERFGPRGGINVSIDIEFWEGQFQIIIFTSAHKAWPDFAAELCSAQGFDQRKGRIGKAVKPTAIKKAILSVVQSVATHFKP